MVYPDYTKSIVNLSNSFLKHFGVQTLHNSLDNIDEILERENKKNVLFILCDGMGFNLINRILPENSFLRENMKGKITSVCPATTTASTTSLLSGMTPMEHGWLGWDVYIPPIDKSVCLFLNTLKDTEEKFDYNIARKYFDYESIIEKINKTNNDAYYISPFGDIKYSDGNIEEFKNSIIDTCNKDGKKFIYAYFSDPDYMMHELGTDNEKVINRFFEIDKMLNELSSKLSDTVIIVSADHGHRNCHDVTLNDYPDLKKLVIKDTSIEARCLSFRVREEDREEFKNLFNKYFENDFLLLTKNEVLEMKLFGDGNENQYFRESIGDFLSLAKNDKGMYYNKPKGFKSTHAGFDADEMYIPLVVKVLK